MSEINEWDVPHHRGNIDFARRKTAGFRFVMFRDGFGRVNPRVRTGQKSNQDYTSTERKRTFRGINQYSEISGSGATKADWNSSDGDYPAITQPWGSFINSTAAKRKYIMKSGDSMCGTAAKYGVFMQALFQANPQGRNPKLAPAGAARTISD